MSTKIYIKAHEVKIGDKISSKGGTYEVFDLKPAVEGFNFYLSDPLRYHVIHHRAHDTVRVEIVNPTIISKGLSKAAVSIVLNLAIDNALDEEEAKANELESHYDAQQKALSEVTAWLEEEAR